MIGYILGSEDATYSLALDSLFRASLSIAPVAIMAEKIVRKAT